MSEKRGKSQGADPGREFYTDEFLQPSGKSPSQKYQVVQETGFRRKRASAGNGYAPYQSENTGYKESSQLAEQKLYAEQAVLDGLEKSGLHH